MKKTFFPFLVFVLLLSSCSAVEGYRFSCVLDETVIEADDMPTATVTNTTITVSVKIDDARFQLTTPYGEAIYPTGSGTANGALIQYWPDEDEVSEFYSSEGPDPDGQVFIDRITSLGVSGKFKGTLYKDSVASLAVKDGDFFAHRP